MQWLRIEKTTRIAAHTVYPGDGNQWRTGVGENLDGSKATRCPKGLKNLSPQSIPWPQC
jgi:hypothetical protein